MKKVLVVTSFFMVFLFIYFWQTIFFSWYNIAGIQPNLFIIFVLFVGLFLGENFGLIFGVVIGLILDLFIGKRIGLNGIMLGIAGLGGGILDKSFSKDSRITFTLMSIIVTILCEVINYTIQIIILGADSAFSKFMYITIIEAIYNGILVIILYPLIQKLGGKTEEIFTENKSFLKYY